MTAVRIDIPDGVASPVWLAHVVRNAVQRALADTLHDPALLQVETEGPAQPLSALQRENQAKGSREDANASCGRSPF